MVLPGVFGSWGERPFIFREFGSNNNYFQGVREQALSVFAHLNKLPYPTGHSEKSSLTLFHETPFLGSVVAQLVKQVSLNG